MPTKSFDAIIIGGGIIGVSLALELRRKLPDVVVIERGAPGREASYAAAGMLNSSDITAPSALAELARRSAESYPTFVDDIQSDSPHAIDFQRRAALVIGASTTGRELDVNDLRTIEPGLAEVSAPVFRVEEDWVDPRTLISAAIACAKHRNVHFVTGAEVIGVLCEQDRLSGVKTAQSKYLSTIAVNCAGAWSDGIAGPRIPARPIKGQMISLLPANETIRHVVRSADPEIYMLPRRGGLVAVGATIEDVGFDKAVVPRTAMNLQQAAAEIVPTLSRARLHESWAGLRPASPDNLPIMGETSLRGYYVATAHFRSGILLAPATAKAMADLILDGKAGCDVRLFSPLRFQRSLILS